MDVHLPRTINDTSQLLEDVHLLQRDTASSDVVLVVGKEEVKFYAHRIILLARCHNFYDHQRVLSSDVSPRGQKYNRAVIQYADLEPSLFKDVLTYIYTGKISLDHDDTDTFEVLNISKSLGLRALQEHCENILAQSLCIDNACLFLNAAIRGSKTEDILGLRALQEHCENILDLAQSLCIDNACLFLNAAIRGSKTEAKDEPDGFHHRCLDYILENAELCVKTTGWLQLTKEAMMWVVRADMFSLKEEEVWRAVLSWAKYHADIPLDKASHEWREAEKNALKKQLHGIIDHIRLLLIDSKVFAEEIEPTGLIPMEVSLERYRLAAVPDQILQSSNRRLRPRSSPHLFHGTTILSKSHLHFQKLLNNWFGNPGQSWHLLYRASRDGSSADCFHRLCDGYSPTFVVTKGRSGNLFGGYSDAPWTSQTPDNGEYRSSNSSFIFTLTNSDGTPPTKYNVYRHKYAVISHPNYGPMFGGGADLCISSNCLQGEECYSNFPHSYGEGVTGRTLNGKRYFDIEDYEVFTLLENLR